MNRPTFEAVAAALGKNPSSSYFMLVATGFCHEQRTPDPSISVRRAKDGGISPKCFTGCTDTIEGWQSVKDAILARAGFRSGPGSAKTGRPVPRTPDAAQKRALGRPVRPDWRPRMFRRLWTAAQTIPPDTPHPASAFGTSELLRWIPAAAFPTSWQSGAAGAVACRMRRADRRRTEALALVFLDACGAKAAPDKRTVRRAECADLRGCVGLVQSGGGVLHVAEGMKDAVAVLSDFRTAGQAVGFAAGTAGMKQAELVQAAKAAGFERLVVWCDADSAGIEAADALGRNAVRAGLGASRQTPPAGHDPASAPRLPSVEFSSENLRCEVCGRLVQLADGRDTRPWNMDSGGPQCDDWEECDGARAGHAV